jgi:aspartyl-tRNA(Asn)/glutamyl-tRNA(Gln) amidotransferase subunit A
MKSIILQMHDQLISGKKTVADFVDVSIRKIDEIKHTNSVVNDSFSIAKTRASKLENKIKENSSNLLFGIPFAMKDNVCTKDVITTGGSLFLKDFVPPYNATITTLLDNVNSVMVCKSNLDEFGLGGTGTHSAYGIVKSVLNNELIVGGSSSGSVNLVAAGAVSFAIGTDTGDSVRRPSSFVGTVGYKPTYGLISRYGVLPYAPSMDHVGVIAKTVTDVAIVSEALIAYDSKDFSSQKINDNHFYKNIKPINKLKVGVIKNLEKYLPSNTCKAYLDAIKIIEKQGHKIEYIDFDEKLLKAIHAIYYAISYSEAVSCWANLSGIIFGANFGGANYDEILKIARSKTLGNQIKRRFTIGQYITRKDNFDKVFLRAQKIRRFLVNK